MDNKAKTFIDNNKDRDAADVLVKSLDEYDNRIALASSMSAEDQVITDMLCKTGRRVRIFTLDTGRLPDETYEVIDATNRKYNIHIEIVFPDRAEVERLVNSEGPNLFYGSIEGRKKCCNVRKVLPLKRKLAELDGWITGLRREQSVTRQTLEKVEWDYANDIMKINPLADWSQEQVWDYIRENGVPYNKLHDKGYPSIGCGPCTRAVESGQDIRAGRWWWEQPEHKECGLHVVDGKLQRIVR